MNNFKIAIFALLVVGMLAVGCINFGGEPIYQVTIGPNDQNSATQIKYPSLQLISPTDGEKIQTNGTSVNVAVLVETSNILLRTPAMKNVPGEGHLYFALDSSKEITTEKKGYTFENVGLGVHTLKVEIRHNDNTPYNPKIMKIITFTVQKDSDMHTATSYEVSIENGTFVPREIQIRVGDTVTWRNNDIMPHTATSTGNFNTGAISQGSWSNVTFNQEGTFEYICTLHPSMIGKVIVSK
ncbi:MAG: cupredoxin family copper-binding protein [Candidatus Micrarchaeia archaeon]